MSATKDARNQAYLDGYELRPVFERYQGTDLEPYFLAGVWGRPQISEPETATKRRTPLKSAAIDPIS